MPFLSVAPIRSDAPGAVVSDALGRQPSAYGRIFRVGVIGTSYDAGPGNGMPAGGQRYRFKGPERRIAAGSADGVAYSVWSTPSGGNEPLGESGDPFCAWPASVRAVY